MNRFVVKHNLSHFLAVVLACWAFASVPRPVRAESETSAPVVPATPPVASATVTFDQVLPVFRKRCVVCHDRDRQKGDLDLSSVEGIKSGGATGAAVLSGNPDESPIYTLTAHLDAPKMPPNNPKIPQREIDLIRRWIEGGLAVRDAVSKPAPQ